ncbi:MAG TPA: 23S rRNA (uracil(1939)-C(5))-methyltransferase RlmD [Acholeplasmataceae bacterium]|nr:23S rRNA (uracil(1939)-C(5))-methyltransferase RlmD [Acholeplasmataceae bacterium]
MRFKIERMASDGEGIAYYKKKPVFIYYAYLGEEVEAQLFVNKRGAYEANLIDVIKKSKARVDVSWPHYMKSGSVNLLHINYAEQLKYKRDVVNFLLTTNLKNETNNVKLGKTIPSDNTLYYRNKSYIPLISINGKNQMANYLRGSNLLFPVKELIVEEKAITSTVKSVLPLLDKHKIAAYDFKTKKGHVISLSLRTNLKGEIQLTFVLKQKTDLTHLINDINKTLKNVVSIYQNYVPEYKNSPDIYEGNLKYLSGNKYLEMEIGGFKFYLTPFAFFQLNTKQAEKLYNMIIEKANFSKNDIVLDAYSGVGTISTFISSHVKEVVAVESVKAAVNDMNYSLKVNKINNVKTITGDFVKIVDYLKQRFDKMIFNPPRIGLGNEVCKYILKNSPKTVVYVSCNPKTLVSDLQILTKKYYVESISPFDMFPQTSQIENIVILKLKNEYTKK